MLPPARCRDLSSKPEDFLSCSVLFQKSDDETDTLSFVIPAKAGIQRSFEVLDSGSPPAFARVGRNDDWTALEDR